MLRRSPAERQAFLRERCPDPQLRGEIEAMLRAYEDGGDSGLRDWMREFFDDKYVDGWDFVTIDDFGIGTPE